MDISQKGIDFIVSFEGKKTLLPDGNYQSYLDDQSIAVSRIMLEKEPSGARKSVSAISPKSLRNMKMLLSAL